MVTAAKYVDAFVKGIKQRYAVISDKRNQKKIIDAKISKSKKLTDKQAAKLILLIGENNKLRPNKQLESQSIRYIFSKMKKSANLIQQNINKLNTSAIEKIKEEDIKEDIRSYIAWIAEHFKEAGNHADQLDSIYAAQVNAVEKNNAADYIAQLENEEAALKWFRNFGTNFSAFYKEIAKEPKIGRLKYLIKNYQGQGQIKMLIILLFSIIYIGPLAIIYFPEIIMQHQFEATLAFWSGAILTFMTAGDIAIKIQDALKNYDQELWLTD